MTLPRLISRLLLPAFAALVLAACGNKGDLVKPTPKPATPPPATTPAKTPATPAAATPSTVSTPSAPEADKH